MHLSILSLGANSPPQSIKIPHPQTSKGWLHTSNTFKFPNPGDIMYNENPNPGDRPHNQIPMGSPIHPPPPLGLNIDRCIRWALAPTFLFCSCKVYYFSLCGQQTRTQSIIHVQLIQKREQFINLYMFHPCHWLVRHTYSRIPRKWLQ